MKQEMIAFSCGKLRLEGAYYQSEAEGLMPAVVVCHPHPLYGGSMDNNVTMAIAHSLIQNSVNALLFNFRGVGKSEGSHGQGIREQEDVRAALDWLEQRSGVDRDSLGLAGYSFGAGVVLPVGCSDPRVKGFALISPYIQGAKDTELNQCTRPKLIIGGDEDDIIGRDLFAHYRRDAAEPKQVQLVRGADHFWLGFEDRMADIVARFFTGIFKKDQGM